MEKNPHLLVEGMILAGYAIGSTPATSTCAASSSTCSIVSTRRSPRRGPPACSATSVAGTGFRFELHTHLGAGAYICGEETALLSSLEGYRGQPRLKPPFPAVEGLYALPDGGQQRRDADERAAHPPERRARGTGSGAPRRAPGTKVFSVSGPVKRPGNYEVPLGTPLRTLIEEYCGGMRDGLEAQGHHPRRLVGADAAGVADSTRALDYESHERGGHVPRLGRGDRDRRPDLHRGRAAGTSAGSTATSRAASARRAARARTG